MQSARYNGKPAWFIGSHDRGDYYDQTTNQYLTSWDRDQGAFLDDSKIGTYMSRLATVKKILPNTGNTDIASLEDPVRMPGKYVAFVGDSYCGCIDMKRFDLYRTWYGDHKRGGHDASYLSKVADHFALNLAHYGFPGRSWWFSWSYFWRDWAARLDEIDAVIFVHTENTRVNNAWNKSLPHTVHFLQNDEGFNSTKQEKKAYKSFVTHVLDDDFQLWAQLQYLKYLKEQLDHIKTIHFFSFNHVTETTAATLPGVVFTDPLHLISIYETDRINPGHEDQNDYRANHLNETNNTALADLIIACLEDYRPGRYSLPMDEFDVPYLPLKKSWYSKHYFWPSL